uniref:Uncharacterized protein n=1 Tax=Aegilops tauschii subsp. strangulata TaxID=200361 RepID=A0A453RZG9_AEGTS
MHVSLDGILSQYNSSLSSYCVFSMGLFSGDQMNAEPFVKFTFKL